MLLTNERQAEGCVRCGGYAFVSREVRVTWGCSFMSLVLIVSVQFGIVSCNIDTKRIWGGKQNDCTGYKVAT
jgi:hypothetical protein